MDELEFYRAKDGVRWRYKAAGNHEVLADGGQGYERLADATEAAYRVAGLEESTRHAMLASATDSIATGRADGSSVLVVFTDV